MLCTYLTSAYTSTQVSDFPRWLDSTMLRPLELGPVAEQRVRRRLRARFSDAFVPDGKHKHSLRVGSNLARLPPATLAQLRAHPRVSAVMNCLGYV